MVLHVALYPCKRTDVYFTYLRQTINHSHGNVLPAYSPAGTVAADSIQPVQEIGTI